MKKTHSSVVEEERKRKASVFPAMAPLYQVVRETAGSSMATWHDTVKRWNWNQHDAVLNEMSEEIERLVRFWSYATWFERTKNHERAVKEQNKAAAKARKMLGYSYPRFDITF